MPHQCTGCGHTFEDGSKEMLSGCPDCGGNKFQFRPAGTTADPALDDASGDGEAATGSSGPPAQASEPSTGESPEQDRPKSDTSSVAETVGRATTQLRDLVSSGPETPATSDDTQSPDPPDRSDRPARSDSPNSSPVDHSDSPSDASGPPSAASSDSSPPNSSAASPDSSSPDPEAEWPDDWDNGTSDSTGDARSSRNKGVTTDTDPETHTHSKDPDSAADGEIIDADARRDDVRPPDSGEDLAQSSARSDVVSPSELDDKSTDTPTSVPEAPSSASDDATQPTDPESPLTEGSERPANGEVVSEPTDEEPDLADLREQLNDQFESIKILEPGQYELNLMELYDREEYIIALQENGRYVIQVPEQWIGEDPDDR